jgi:hypothetical protein
VASGAGVGLFVCRRLVEAMGGHMWARPRRGGGSDFGFWLPEYSADLELDDDPAVTRQGVDRAPHSRVGGGAARPSQERLAWHRYRGGTRMASGNT